MALRERETSHARRRLARSGVSDMDMSGRADFVAVVEPHVGVARSSYGARCCGALRKNNHLVGSSKGTWHEADGDARF